MTRHPFTAALDYAIEANDLISAALMGGPARAIYLERAGLMLTAARWASVEFHRTDEARAFPDECIRVRRRISEATRRLRRAS